MHTYLRFIFFICLVCVSKVVAQDPTRLIDYDTEGNMYTVTNGNAGNFVAAQARLTRYSLTGVKLKEQPLQLFGNEYPVEIKVDERMGSVYVLSKTLFTPSFNLQGTQEFDVILASYDLRLNLKWYYYFNYDALSSWDVPLGMTTDSVGNVLFAVNTFTNDSLINTLSNSIVKVGNQGNLIYDSQMWASRITPNAVITCLSVIASGEVFAGGYVTKRTKKGIKKQSILLAFDSKGRLRWQKEIESSLLKSDKNNYISSLQVNNKKQLQFIIKTFDQGRESYTGRCSDSKLDWIKFVPK